MESPFRCARRNDPSGDYRGARPNGIATLSTGNLTSDLQLNYNYNGSGFMRSILLAMALGRSFATTINQ